ncbi:unnamed protein product [Phyllotreta striolata]|uniref:Sorting nexin-14-like n=1 Tax=Phyllotreta striolata TaxID=444603 RepID=A0A9N9TSD6_PHYSR|nr:unnamed protein product [Phyllotreta striolata]
MIYTEIIDNLRLLTNDILIRNITITMISLVGIFSIFFRPLGGLMMYFAYIFGFTTAWLLVKYKHKATIYLQRIINFYKGKISNKKVLKQSCSICDDLSCRRHQQSKSITPWKHIYVSEELNKAVEQLFEKIISNFVSSWYTQFTDDEDFLNELRYCFKFSTSTIINRLQELDVGDVVANKLVPCVVRHVDDYLYIQQIAKLKNVRFNEVVIEYLGKKLHAAATNRKNELDYLRHLISSLLVHILPGDYLKCRNFSIMMREILSGWVFLPMMDAIADPNIINYLVILITSYRSKKSSKLNQNAHEVEFLSNYVSCEKKTSSFSTSLTKIKKDTDLLYAFMQFLKNQDHVNLLQFCLDVDDFNSKMLMPELSKKQIEELHNDALKLYKEYLDKSSFSYISCPSDISEDFKFLMQDIYAVEKISKLSKLLCAAYEFVFNILENVWLPQFFHSNEFYSCICGSKHLTGYSKGHHKIKRYDSTNPGPVSKFSSGLGKIKGVLKTNQPVEGAFYPPEAQLVENGTADDMFLEDCKNLFRDMSTWKVDVPTFQTNPTNKVVYFYISIERTDSSEGSRRNWVVLRKDQDFYTLKAKLIEFHGESEICDSPLPSRKAGSSIETRMAKYEEFLRKLLQKSALKGSDLLYYFLTTEEDFQIYLATNASQMQDIGNIYQSVAYKLRKEKGQHLDPFMASFLMSTGRTKTEKLEWAEVGEESVKLFTVIENILFPKTYRNQVFNDNFGVHYKVLKDTMSSSLSPEGITESAFYLLKNVFKIPYGLLRLYASVCSIGQYFVDMSARILIEKKIRSGLCHSNLTYLIKQLEDVIFNEYKPTNREQLEQRKIKAFEDLTNSVSPIVNRILGPGLKDGLKTTLDILQNPHFNKQLAYNLLDIILTEMYPMLDKYEEHYLN